MKRVVFIIGAALGLGLLLTSAASELALLGEMGYDAVTFGNHDFDFHPSGLADALQAARAKKKRPKEVIVSGHTHTVLPKPILVGKTIIVSSGCYGAYLGVLDVACPQSGGVELLSCRLLPIESGSERIPRGLPRGK